VEACARVVKRPDLISEEKKQHSVVSAVPQQMNKSFCFFFSKKKAFLA
jgi:hypothetical protein